MIRPNVQNLAIFISDGVPFPAERKDPAIREAEALKGVSTVIAIGISNVIDQDLLRTISSSPQERKQELVFGCRFQRTGCDQEISWRRNMRSCCRYGFVSAIKITKFRFCNSVVLRICNLLLLLF